MEDGKIAASAAFFDSIAFASVLTDRAADMNDH
jgi:ketosteroid isomerase-like protein